MLRLASVFSFKNNTSHMIELLAQEGMTAVSLNQIGNDNNLSSKENPFTLKSGEIFHIPIALMHRSVVETKGKSLGRVFMRPGDLKSIENELGARSQAQLSHVDYSRPVDLLAIVHRTAALLNEMNIEAGATVFGRDLADSTRAEISCYIHTKSNRRRKVRSEIVTINNQSPVNAEDTAGSPSTYSSKLPPFGYSLEIQRMGTLIEGEKNSTRMRGAFFHQRGSLERIHDPIHYMIVIHPPIILENLLPMSAVFEIVNATQHNRVLWSSRIDPGK